MSIYGLKHGVKNLQTRLEEICAQKRIEAACVGLIDADGCHQAFSCSSSDASISMDSIEVGCFAKVMTAILIAQLVHEGVLNLQDEARDYFAACNDSRTSSMPSCIKISQLLNHTHGLDGAWLSRAPLSSNGRIDTDGLLRELSSKKPIAEPGDLYNYSAIGACFAAAILERIYDCKYADILSERLLQPIRAVLRQTILSSRASNLELCPASGGSMMLSLDEVLTLLSSQVGSQQTVFPFPQILAAPLKILLAPIVPLSGWSPTEKAAALGWKCYGAGWFGHNAKTQHYNLLIRFNPERKLAIVISARGAKADAPLLILATLFGDLVPELLKFNFPVLLDSSEWSQDDAGKFTGIYENSAFSVAIEQSQDKLQMMTASATNAGEKVNWTALRPLKPAKENIFLPNLAEFEMFPFIQFIRQGPESRFQYIWNGRHLWKRTY